MNKVEIMALGLTTVAGLSMGVGSLLSFFIKGTNKRALSIALSFSAGIMIYVSFMAIFPEGIELIEEGLGGNGRYLALIGFFGGMLITALLEKVIHRFGGHYHGHDGDEIEDHNHDHEGEHLSKLGLMSAVAIAIHNLPEGLAIFTAGLKDMSVAIPIAFAVILHNIPLSVAISVPIYYSTKSRTRAFLYSVLVGLCQPLGALLGYLLLSNFFSDLLFGILYTIVAGIMIFVSLDELLPSSQKYEDHHISVYAAIAGMIVMALSMHFFHIH